MKQVHNGIEYGDMQLISEVGLRGEIDRHGYIIDLCILSCDQQYLKAGELTHFRRLSSS